MIEFNPTTTELIQSGATAELLLDAQRTLSEKCVEEILRKIDHAMDNDAMTSERALQFVAELAAFRRIVTRQRTLITQGRAAARRLVEDSHA